ncbi:multidrug efflux RND transporter permease subunit [Iodidimonas muriae]|uniref:Efflux pump membrane transporter n=1 Tax=Iodidimonas muriae TaxID=261467 RepID=A0ABQ2LDS1_9PROT|nr:multidrug efflux RND transporter permease subunit [Iodidimonas muriae]GER07142.1 multidrug efflux RND transporter permease subunit [Kordiimonadales bacterium JCM 17843]GGO12862.1 multidrug efflux RND transporter permease subunit [Iodidimonas muriae]
MRFAHFFINRPIFASAIWVLTILVGLIAYLNLPVAQYPDVAPPTIQVTASFPGASAQTVSETVASVIEEEINGVENMLYISSQSTNAGTATIQVVFNQGTDLDIAQVLVQNRVALAEPRLPAEVRQLGVSTVKSNPDALMVVHLYSPDQSRNQLYISNYYRLQMRDELQRLNGVGQVQAFGLREYAMRVWIDPDRAARFDLNAGDIVAALRGQNLEVASGTLGQQPMDNPGAFEISVQTQGRLRTADEFGDVVLKSSPTGALVRLKDVARLELGAQDYATNASLDGKPALALLFNQEPGANALETAETILETVATMSKRFPEGLSYDVVFNPTQYVAKSVEKVQETIFEAVILVALVVFVFLQSVRAAIIPIVAIPISLIGTFAMMQAFGFSLNNLSLFGLVLSIGIVVDDAIVVVENVERNMKEGMSARDAAHKTIDEVGGALIAIALVLSAVFIPTAFLTGISGEFYRQFAITIASATIISAGVSLTLSPALSAILLKQHSKEDHSIRWWQRPINGFFSRFERFFDRVSHGYSALTGKLIRMSILVLTVYVGLMALTGVQFGRAPTGFIPASDQSYLITVVQMPAGTSLKRTEEMLQRVVATALDHPDVAHAAAFAGLDGATFTTASNSGTVFLPLKNIGDRMDRGRTLDMTLSDLRQTFGQWREARILVIPPPPVRGIGNSGGFKMYVQDRSGAGYPALEGATWSVAGPANQLAPTESVFTVFNTASPEIYADIDRIKAEQLGIPVEDVLDTLAVYMGSSYVNDFTLFGRSYRVTAQADAPFRKTPEDIARLRVRNADGNMTPIGSVATFEDRIGPYRVARYNLYPAAAVQGDVTAGYSTGEALDAMERLASEKLGEDFSFEWTELALQQKLAGNTAAIAFSLAVVFVFILLAAQYESVTLPLAVILIVPMSLLSAVSGVLMRGMDVNILVQIGFIVLIGLAAKNAILIVEFAKQAQDKGMSAEDAAVEAAHLRLRPIIMTSFAFILGVLPLVIASGAGFEMRQSLGTAVFFGMLGVTGFGLLFTPVFYVTTRKAADWMAHRLLKRPISAPVSAK